VAILLINKDLKQISLSFISTFILYFLPVPSEVCSWRIGICLTLIHFRMRVILERCHKDQLRGIFKTHTQKKHKHKYACKVLAYNLNKSLYTFVQSVQMTNQQPINKSNNTCLNWWIKR